ncbi:transposase [Alkalibacillus filiformis]|uniref:Transposase n=2 Tax=Alkalibacillus filiformis TaxID=200990 RepID=A0ABU0DXB3_9BACI|nr:transposase [Alkalibacillus filiformis]
MPEKKHYSPEFKEYVAKMVLDDGKKIKDISIELKLPYHTLTKWVARERNHRKELEKSRKSELLSATEYKKQLEDERKRVADLEEEVDILKKAMHIFNQNHK